MIVLQTYVFRVMHFCGLAANAVQLFMSQKILYAISRDSFCKTAFFNNVWVSSTDDSL